MYVVSGCPRSGTSMMMSILKDVFGDERILGLERPRESKFLHLNEIQQYIINKKNNKFIRSKEMNPNGYHEMEFTVQGIYYRRKYKELFKEIETGAAPKKICKVVSQGLAKSDPKYISKIIYMVRNPYAVAKSQERLARNNPMDEGIAPEINGEKVLIRSVDMFNAVTVMAANWIKENPQIPIHIVNYDELLNNPVMELSKIQEFLGEGDFSTASVLIDKSLRRSDPENLYVEDGNYAMALYNCLLNGDWDAIVEAEITRIEDIKINPPVPKYVFCTRLNKQISTDSCKLCKTHEQTTRNLINQATMKKIEWNNEPCIYDCIVNKMSIEESINNNHWRNR